MMTFRNHRLRDFAVPMSTNWLLNDLAEAKGKQELYTRQSPQLLKALREMALVQSVESSNRIEGGRRCFLQRERAGGPMALFEE